MKRGKKTKSSKARLPKIQDIELSELKAILARAQSTPLSAEEYEKLAVAVDTLAFLTQELEKKGTSIKRLRNLIFGASTEKTSEVLGKRPGNDAGKPAAGEKKKKRKGHGRNGAAAYTGAENVKIGHESLGHGDRCPNCDKGKVYSQSEPAVMVRVRGMAPLQATVYERQRLRCNLCGEVFTARAPEGVGSEKYDETASSMVALVKYGTGLPFNRIEKLQASLGIPLPAATQWELVRRAWERIAPAYEELVRQAAQGEVLHNDDTTMKILELCGQSRDDAMDDDKADERTGVFTSGIVSVSGGRKIALFFTGRKHAGENLEKVLAERAEELGPPIQMCDLLSRNTAGEFKTIVAGCILHSRRRYVEVADNFPDEVQHVLEELKKVYENDAVCKKEKMTPEERLAFHQAESGPVMKNLDEWLTEQIEEKKVEPNSGLGEAIGFMQRHWDKLTLFLRVPGAPLDNNVVERALKKSILHRKNAYFYKTQNGARVGDAFMSLIHTCELHGADPFDYLVELQRHAEEVASNPAQWMPWNYREALERLDSGPDPPQ